VVEDLRLDFSGCPVPSQNGADSTSPTPGHLRAARMGGSCLLSAEEGFWYQGPSSEGRAGSVRPESFVGLLMDFSQVREVLRCAALAEESAKTGALLVSTA